MVAGGGTLPSPDRHDRIPPNEARIRALPDQLGRNAVAFDHAFEGTEPDRAVTMRGCQGGMPLTTAPDAREDTFPKLLVRNARIRPEPHGVAAQGSRHLAVLDLGARCSTRCAPFRSGLRALGLKRGDKIAIIGDNRPRLYWAMAAAQALGAVPVPVYADSVADEMAYVLEHAEVDASRWWRTRSRSTRCCRSPSALPQLTHMVYDEPRGLRDYDHSKLCTADRRSSEGGREKLAPIRRARAGIERRARSTARAPTSRSSSTPRARPAGRRA